MLNRSNNTKIQTGYPSFSHKKQFLRETLITLLRYISAGRYFRSIPQIQNLDYRGTSWNYPREAKFFNFLRDTTKISPCKTALFPTFSSLLHRYIAWFQTINYLVNMILSLLGIYFISWLLKPFLLRDICTILLDEPHRLKSSLKVCNNKLMKIRCCTPF